jgi:hypothetical protein
MMFVILFINKIRFEGKIQRDIENNIIDVILISQKIIVDILLIELIPGSKDEKMSSIIRI